MKPNLHPLFPLTLILATTIRFSAILCQEIKPYDVCGLVHRCGDLILGYPFWGNGRPAYCGHPDFHVTCLSEDYYILAYESVGYRVVGMDNSTQMITLARDDLWDLDVCPIYLRNTSYDSTLFNGSYFSNVNISLYFRCDPTIYFTNSFSCLINETTNIRSYGYFDRTSVISSGRTGFNQSECDSPIIVPVKSNLADLLLKFDATQYALTPLLKAGFDLQLKTNSSKCDQCLRSGGWCGSNWTRPELFTCYCYTGNFTLTCNSTDVNRAVQKLNIKWKLITGFSCSIAGIIFLCFVILCWRNRLGETRKTANHQLEMFIRDNGTLAPKRYKYSEIKKMTNSFQEELGRGGYGSVYKGLTPDGQLVAVKLLVGAMGDGEDFINEVASISRTSHVNIVMLLGFCIEGKRRALIYEFMPNGSLDKFLRGDGSRLDWNTLFQIAKGIARGLEYLHRGCSTRIVHFDIKPNNILLDEEFVPKISDFGLAKLCKKKESIVSVMGARGTIGYMAPEVHFRSLGGASHKSDVYSYGMMVLEMTGARNNNNASPKSTSVAYFPDWIYNNVEAGDNLGVNGVTTEYEDELARKMVTVSLWCIQYGPSDRPSIGKVVEMLEGSLESLQVPPKRFWSSPTRLAQGTFPLATQSSTNKTLSTVQSVREILSS